MCIIWVLGERTLSKCLAKGSASGPFLCILQWETEWNILFCVKSLEHKAKKAHKPEGGGLGWGRAGPAGLLFFSLVTGFGQLSLRWHCQDIRWLLVLTARMDETRMLETQSTQLFDSGFFRREVGYIIQLAFVFFFCWYFWNQVSRGR